jgi:ABC-type uncharacterized transport system auxiliary subunit
MSCRKIASFGVALSALGLLACSGGLRSDEPAAQLWRLHPPALQPAEATTAPPATGILRVQHPLVAAWLDNDRIALQRADRSLDYFAANRWSARVAALVESLALDVLRAAGGYHAVEPEGSPFGFDETLQIEVRDFQAVYGAGAAPTVRVTLVCTLGRHADRSVLKTFTLAGSAVAADNRMRAIVAAFDAALGEALGGLPARLR